MEKTTTGGEAQGAKNLTEEKAPMRMQFKTLGALREMTNRIGASDVLTKEEFTEFEKLTQTVRERWIRKNT